MLQAVGAGKSASSIKACDYQDFVVQSSRAKLPEDSDISYERTVSLQIEDLGKITPFKKCFFLRMQETAFSGPDDRTKPSLPFIFQKKNTLRDPKSGIPRQGPSRPCCGLTTAHGPEAC